MFIITDDLTPFASIDDEKADAMIADAEALALLVAPGLDRTGEDDDPLTDPQLAAVKAILRAAILRWNEAGNGILSQRSAGPFSETIDTRQTRRGMFTPAEIEQLQSVVAGEDGSGIFSIDTVPTCANQHSDICSLYFGATYCSCGAVLAGFPLYESSDW